LHELKLKDVKILACRVKDVATIVKVARSVSSLFPFSKEKQTVQYCKSKLHNYQIGIISLLRTFENFDCYQPLRKARAVFRWHSPWEKVGMRL